MDLNRNRILYADIIEIIRNHGSILYETQDAIIVQERNSGLLSAASLHATAANAAVQHIPAFNVLAVHDLYLKAALENRGHTCTQVCWQCAYVKSKAPAYLLPAGYVIQAPQAKHIPQMIEMYWHSKPDLANEEEFKRALQDGMKAVFYQDTLCAFIGLHEEYSMGLLEVLPEHRKKGLAFALESAMIADLLKKGALPYGQVIKGNTKSLQLQKKIGMDFCEEETYWFF